MSFSMKLVLWYAVLVVLALRETEGCQGGCQQENCCGGCRAFCTTQACVQSCCSSCCCNRPKPAPYPTPYPSTPYPPAPGPVPTPYPPSPGPIPTPYPPPSPSDTNVENNVNATLDVTINNHINIENRVYIPISINNTNVQSVSIVSEENCTITDTGTTECPTPHTTTSPTTITPSSTTGPTTHPTGQPTTPTKPRIHIIPVPVPYPVYQRYPVPIPYYPHIPQPGCCTVIRPCVSSGCQSHRNHCGSGCLGNMMYEPVNPCYNGCRRKSWGFRPMCFGQNSCIEMPVNCMGCNNNFFESYQGFQQCGGCFSGGYGSYGGHDGTFGDIGGNGGAWGR
ncbi:unnamed protein product [Acanthoscelides obtectus]|uniref:Uncharacterized protein n=1 Tax=Acanthoscelides obtectus TaxID=200917 RepID=A0A9P0MAZ5_ACAOB|nr:unnamed protein product [Acanthoscelides obtectus]CAK1638567.1 hypothetical protein AOBTE_LOCUS10669 [Acanthoscelides obtectus]